MSEAKYDRPTYTSDFVKSDTENAVFLGNPLLDNMMTAMMSLGAEVWSAHRRMKVLERLLEDKGITNAMVEAYIPTEEETVSWQAERDAFVERTFGVLAQQGNLTLGQGRSQDTGE
jgi:hypothetical protein